jgi:hypothetical protein
LYSYPVADKIAPSVNPAIEFEDIQAVCRVSQRGLVSEPLAHPGSEALILNASTVPLTVDSKRIRPPKVSVLVNFMAGIKCPRLDCCIKHEVYNRGESLHAVRLSLQDQIQDHQLRIAGLFFSERSTT